MSGGVAWFCTDNVAAAPPGGTTRPIREDGMTIDLTSGMEASKDFFLPKCPDDAQFRESASFWVSDDQGVVGLPRVGIEAVAESWDKRDLQVNLGLPDGRAAGRSHALLAFARDAGRHSPGRLSCAAPPRPE